MTTGSQDGRPARPTMRLVAKHAGVSTITVSRALRDSPRVPPAERKRIAEVARRLGYARNPLEGELMSMMRRAKNNAFRGLLAVLDLDGPEGRDAGAKVYHQELARGAIECAHRHGFSADLITVADELSLSRLDSILRTRGISGVFILPVRDQPDLRQLDWQKLSAVYADLLIEKPALHSICADHYRGMLTALEHLHALGYRRPGLVLSAEHNARLLHRMEAAFRTFLGYHADMAAPPPLFTLPSLTEKAFADWFCSADCDVVLARVPEVPAWMRKLGARIPETHGFCALNTLNHPMPCAGLDLQPRQLGERGMELLIGMIVRNERGVPDEPMNVTLPVKWMAGPTVRPRPLG